MNKIKTFFKRLLKDTLSGTDAAIKVVVHMFFVGVGLGLGFTVSALYVWLMYLSALQKAVG